MPTNIGRTAQVTGKKLAPIKTYAIVSDYSVFPEIAPPSLVIESVGLVGEPDQDGEGNLSGSFAVSVFSTVQGPKTEATRELALSYWWPIAASLMQHRKLESGIWVEKFVDSGFAGANVDQRRTRVAAEHVFHVRLENFLSVSEGPTDPEEIPDDWPIAESVSTEVEQKED